MEVVDGKQERRFRAQIHGQPVERVERSKADSPAASSSPSREKSKMPAAAAARPKGCAHVPWVGETGLEQLAHNAEGVLALELAAARRQDDQPTCGRTPAPIGDKTGLADPAGPSTRTSPGSPASVFATARSSWSSSRSRSSKRGGPWSGRAPPQHPRIDRRADSGRGPVGYAAKTLRAQFGDGLDVLACESALARMQIAIDLELTRDGDRPVTARLPDVRLAPSTAGWTRTGDRRVHRQLIAQATPHRPPTGETCVTT